MHDDLVSAAAHQDLPYPADAGFIFVDVYHFMRGIISLGRLWSYVPSNCHHLAEYDYPSFGNLYHRFET